MTALQIIQHLRQHRRDVLWLNDERREAGLHVARRGHAIPLDYNEARVARTDTGLRLVEHLDGDLVVAS